MLVAWPVRKKIRAVTAAARDMSPVERKLSILEDSVKDLGFKVDHMLGMFAKLQQSPGRPQSIWDACESEQAGT
jgi:hypothetical protein